MAEDTYKPLTEGQVEFRNRQFAQSHDLMPGDFTDWLRRVMEHDPPNFLSDAIVNFGDAVRSTLLTVTTITGAYTLKDSDNVAHVNATGGSFALTLPTAVGRRGKVFYFKKMDAVDTATLTADGSETIDGVGTYSLDTQYETLTIFSDGTEWLILSTG